MNTLIETARKLITECCKEVPCLAEVQRLCETTFGELKNPPKKMRHCFPDTDEKSKESTRATFVAYYWMKDNSGINPLLEFEGDILSASLENDAQRELFLLIIILKTLHNIQLLLDPRFLNEPRGADARFLSDERELQAFSAEYKGEL